MGTWSWIHLIILITSSNHTRVEPIDKNTNALLDDLGFYYNTAVRWKLLFQDEDHRDNLCSNKTCSHLHSLYWGCVTAFTPDAKCFSTLTTSIATRKRSCSPQFQRMRGSSDSKWCVGEADIENCRRFFADRGKCSLFLFRVEFSVTNEKKILRWEIKLLSVADPSKVPSSSEYPD